MSGKTSKRQGGPARFSKQPSIWHRVEAGVDKWGAGGQGGMCDWPTGVELDGRGPPAHCIHPGRTHDGPRSFAALSSSHMVCRGESISRMRWVPGTKHVARVPSRGGGAAYPLTRYNQVTPRTKYHHTVFGPSRPPKAAGAQVAEPEDPSNATRVPVARPVSGLVTVVISLRTRASSISWMRWCAQPPRSAAPTMSARTQCARLAAYCSLSHVGSVHCR
jgi:hypothetical protein